MKVNFKNETKDNLRIRIVPRTDTVINEPLRVYNPTLVKDETDSVNFCLSKKRFICVPSAPETYVWENLGQVYFAQTTDDQVCVSTVLITTPQGTISVTEQWVKSEFPYSDILNRALPHNVDFVGSGNYGHFQIYSGRLSAPTTTVVDGTDWISFRFVATPDKPEGAFDYGELVVDEIGEFDIISCEAIMWPGL